MDLSYGLVYLIIHVKILPTVGLLTTSGWVISATRLLNPIFAHLIILTFKS